MEKLLLEFINDPYNDINNFELGYSYENIGQTASALSYYLRCAEFTKNDDLAYEALLRMSLCLSKQGNRETMEITCIQHALSLLPERPEGNYLMSLYYSYREKWLESYMFACNGLSNNKIFYSFKKEFPYFDNYQLKFQKAYSGYHKGKINESQEIYYDLLNNYEINDYYRDIITDNLKIYSNQEKLHPINTHKREEKEIHLISSIHNEINKEIPELIVIDQFYNNPDSVREYALKLNYLKPDDHGAVGYRSEKGRKINNETKEFFEKILQCKIKEGKNIGEWEYPTNGCFQWCSKDIPLVYHADNQEYAGIVYLTPDAPIDCGTSILRHKEYKIKDKCIFLKEDWNKTTSDKEKLYLDKTPWEEVDRIGNIYNRLILFRSHNIHAVTRYFGETIHDSRLFQLFFFDIDKEDTISDTISYEVKEVNHKIGIDVGACIGETLHDFDNYDIIYAIEPGREEYIQLKEKYKNNKRIIPLNYAISEEDGDKILNCYANGRFSSFLEFNKNGDFYKFCQENVDSFDILKEKINVRTKRLDTFIDENKITEIDFLKIDTQGYDLNVVKSLGGYINKVNKIQLRCQVQELYEKSYMKDDIIKYMSDYNFKLIGNKYGEISKKYEEDLIFEKNIFNDHSLDIVLQGKYNDNVLFIAEYYLELEFVNNIIISCWDGDDIPIITNDRIKVIQSKIPDNPGTGQRNLQIVSSLAGIKETTTEFVIKIRNDQRYTKESMINMYRFYEKYKERKLSYYYDEQKPRNRICVSGNFQEFSFHPRDHLFWGNREDLLELFSLPLEKGKITDKIKFIQPEDYSLYYDHFIRTETYIGAHYLSNFNRNINYYLLDPKKYLYDNSECYQETKILSDELTPQIFKSFPKEGIDLEWYKYKWKTYPYKNQREKFGERWHEDGL